MLTMSEINSLRAILDKEEEEAKHKSSKEFFYYCDRYIYHLSIYWAYGSIEWYVIYRSPQGGEMELDPLADSMLGVMEYIPVEVEEWMNKLLTEKEKLTYEEDQD